MKADHNFDATLSVYRSIYFVYPIKPARPLLGNGVRKFKPPTLKRSKDASDFNAGGRLA
jgi:hypothetical protein